MPSRTDRRSAEAQGYRALYHTAEWQRVRERQLKAHPWCSMCEAQGVTTRATVCDHRYRHRGDPVLFFKGPFDSLCKPHHDSTKQRQERTGIVRGNGADGRPLDPNHPWNRSR